MSDSRHSFGERERQNLEFLIAAALEEDLLERGDITSLATIPANARGAARLVARSPGVLAGLPAVEILATKFEPNPIWTPRMADGDRLETGSLIGRLAGPMRLAARHGANGTQLPPAIERNCLSDRALCRGGARHPRGHLRHAQDNAGLAFSREIRSPLRRRIQSPIRTP